MAKQKLTLWVESALTNKAKKILGKPPKKSISQFVEEKMDELIRENRPAHRPSESDGTI